ncbi:hypothetical protein CIB43_00881 [Mesomycoplasma hyopneumoniae]|uniref:Uncharacterized protein n=3 Tax=Mesomycoplasma hyopneumoniae TaxID=2099 RepID=A0A223MB65_MESHO|nr:hypothetical protein [Mesomycoplasma hyopneumoniae]AGQ51140.1 hypothetical protein MHL_3385 [Mesomycoplasma hyopneumoniae 7422]ASU14764.1 hypothetical protein CIB43_00881 [Mesomycoplasma hyopneumoniae]
MKSEKNRKIVEEILRKYGLHEKKVKWYWGKFLTKKLNKIYFILKLFWSIFLPLAAIFTIIVIILQLSSLRTYSSDWTTNENRLFAIWQLIYTAISCWIITTIFALPSFIITWLNPKRRFEMKFGKGAMEKFISEIEFTFKNIQKVELIPDITKKPVIVNKLTLPQLSLLAKKYLIFAAEGEIDFNFRIITSKNLVFYLDFSQIFSNFDRITNGNFLVVESKFINNKNKKLLEQNKFKFLEEKLEKLVFQNQNKPFYNFEIILEKPSFLKIIEKINEEVQIKFQHLDEIAAIINNQ